jgi:hypothetical protein
MSFVKMAEEEKYPNGDKYFGDLNSAKQRHGKGVYYFADGRIYDGEWRNDKRHGWGTLEYAPTDNELKFDASGMPIWEWAKRAKYEGEWVDDKKHGKGTFTYEDGRYLEGEWINDQFQKPPEAKKPASVQATATGARTYVETTLSDGTVYKGEIVDGKRNGKGKLTWPSGAWYDGEWRDDKIHGKGVARYKTGDIYDGDFANGNRHGRGRQIQADGACFEGEWRDNKFVG